MTILLVIILIIGLGGIIGNQYSALKRMESIQNSLDDINDKLGKLNRN